MLCNVRHSLFIHANMNVRHIKGVHTGQVLFYMEQVAL